MQGRVIRACLKHDSVAVTIRLLHVDLVWRKPQIADNMPQFEVGRTIVLREASELFPYPSISVIRCSSVFGSNTCLPRRSVQQVVPLVELPERDNTSVIKFFIFEHLELQRHVQGPNLLFKRN